MATEIWNESFVDMITKDQIRYMLEKYLSPGSILEQISKGTNYEFIIESGKDVGFIAYKKEEEKLMLSKFYLCEEYRHTGLASYSLDHIVKIARELNLNSIYLNVNRKNVEAISAYEHWGFISVKDVDADIGNGFFMNDHVMELDLKNYDFL